MNFKDVKFKQFMCKTTLSEDLQVLTRRDSRPCCPQILSYAVLWVLSPAPWDFQPCCLGILSLASKMLDRQLGSAWVPAVGYSAWLSRIRTWLPKRPHSLASQKRTVQLGYPEGSLVSVSSGMGLAVGTLFLFIWDCISKICCSISRHVFLQRTCRIFLISDQNHVN